MGLNRIFYEIGLTRGVRHEDRVLELLHKTKRSFVKSSRAATKEEDHRGIDIVIETDVGKIFLQVKSSWKGVEKFHHKYGSSRTVIIPIVVNEGMDDTKIYETLWMLISKERLRVLDFRSHSQRD